MEKNQVDIKIQDFFKNIHLPETRSIQSCQSFIELLKTKQKSRHEPCPEFLYVLHQIVKGASSSSEVQRQVLCHLLNHLFQQFPLFAAINLVSILTTDPEVNLLSNQKNIFGQITIISCLLDSRSYSRELLYGMLDKLWKFEDKNIILHFKTLQLIQQLFSQLSKSAFKHIYRKFLRPIMPHPYQCNPDNLWILLYLHERDYKFDDGITNFDMAMYKDGIINSLKLTILYESNMHPLGPALIKYMFTHNLISLWKDFFEETFLSNDDSYYKFQGLRFIEIALDYITEIQHFHAIITRRCLEIIFHNVEDKTKGLNAATLLVCNKIVQVTCRLNSKCSFGIIQNLANYIFTNFHVQQMIKSIISTFPIENLQTFILNQVEYFLKLEDSAEIEVNICLFSFIFDNPNFKNINKPTRCKFLKLIAMNSCFNTATSDKYHLKFQNCFNESIEKICARYTCPKVRSHCRLEYLNEYYAVLKEISAAGIFKSIANHPKMVRDIDEKIKEIDKFSFNFKEVFKLLFIHFGIQCFEKQFIVTIGYNKLIRDQAYAISTRSIGTDINKLASNLLDFLIIYLSNENCENKLMIYDIFESLIPFIKIDAFNQSLPEPSSPQTNLRKSNKRKPFTSNSAIGNYHCIFLLKIYLESQLECPNLSATKSRLANVTKSWTSEQKKAPLYQDMAAMINDISAIGEKSTISKIIQEAKPRIIEPDSIEKKLKNVMLTMDNGDLFHAFETIVSLFHDCNCKTLNAPLLEIFFKVVANLKKSQPHFVYENYECYILLVQQSLERYKKDNFATKSKYTSSYLLPLLRAIPELFQYLQNGIAEICFGVECQGFRKKEMLTFLYLSLESFKPVFEEDQFKNLCQNLMSRCYQYIEKNFKCNLIKKQLEVLNLLMKYVPPSQTNPIVAKLFKLPTSKMQNAKKMLKIIKGRYGSKLKSNGPVH